MLIAFAGADGAGKSTLSKLVEQELRRKGFDAVRLDRFDILNHAMTPASRFIETDILTLRQSVMAMPSASARLLFILWSMAITASSQINDHPGRVIIYDSYWMKHTAAEIIFGADEQAAIAAAGLLPKPDLVFYIRLESEHLLARKPDDRVPYECGFDADCRPESFLSHQRRIQAYLDAWSKRFGWQEIDGAKSQHALAAELAGRIEAAMAPQGAHP